MKITLIGYGKMGRLIEKKAKERNHLITNILDSQDWNLENLIRM